MRFSNLHFSTDAAGLYSGHFEAFTPLPSGEHRETLRYAEDERGAITLWRYVGTSLQPVRRCPLRREALRYLLAQLRGR